MKDPVAVEAAFAKLATSPVRINTYWRHQVTDSVYYITRLSVDEARLVPLVTYRSLDKGYEWTRDLDVFIGPNENGVPRFVEVDRW